MTKNKIIYIAISIRIYLHVSSNCKMHVGMLDDSVVEDLKPSRKTGAWIFNTRFSFVVPYRIGNNLGLCKIFSCN